MANGTTGQRRRPPPPRVSTHYLAMRSISFESIPRICFSACHRPQPRPLIQNLPSCSAAGRTHPSYVSRRQAIRAWNNARQWSKDPHAVTLAEAESLVKEWEELLGPQEACGSTEFSVWGEVSPPAPPPSHSPFIGGNFLWR